MGRPQKSPITFGNDLKCGHCGKYYESRQSMRSHLIRHGQRVFKCEICSESYHTKREINSAHLPKIKRDSPVKDENQSPKSESSKVSTDRSPRSVPAARQTYQPGMFMPYLALMQVPVESSAEQIGYPRISVTRNDEQCTRGSVICS